YIIVDPFLAPAEHQPFYSERLVRLPHCYQPSDTSRPAAMPAASRAACGLPAGGLVLCSFNHSYKLTPAGFDLWVGLLRGMAGSMLDGIGLPELATTSLPEYEARALEFMREPARLAELRRRLADNRSRMPLFDMARYTRNIEAAYRAMWDRWRAGELPAPF